MLSSKTFIVTDGTTKHIHNIFQMYKHRIDSSRSPQLFVGDWGYLQEYQDKYGRSGGRG